MIKDILAKRYVVYVLIVAGMSWVLFNVLLTRQGQIMYDYFIAQPSDYNVERSQRLAASVRNSFDKEVDDPTEENIRKFVKKYDDLPFLSVNFIYRDGNGIMHSTVGSIKDLDILGADHTYPIFRDNWELGTLLIHSVEEAYAKGFAEYNKLLTFTRVFFAVVLCLVISVMLYKEYSHRIEQEKKLAQYEAVHDGLTGLYTQKYFKQYLEKEISRSKRYKRPLSLIMCDIDHFKGFNDRYGHLAGDRALKKVAGIIKDNIRSSDIVARYGGEEFSVLLVEAGHEEARTVAKRIRDLTEESVKLAARIKDSIEKAEFRVKDTTARLTISMGISSYAGQENYKKEYLISEADLALYESKNHGRNMITLYDPRDKEFSSFS